MLGKTHMMTGIAAALAVAQPITLSELILATGAGAVGGLLPDMDIGTTEFHKEADKITFLTVLVVAAVFALDHYAGTKIVENILRNSGQMRIISGFLFLIGICAYGKEQPHRSFLHSFLGLVLLSIALGILAPVVIPHFMVGYLSHLALDLLNKKGVKLFYPWKKGFCFRLFRSKGIIDTCIFLGAAAAAIMEIYWSLHVIYLL